GAHPEGPAHQVVEPNAARDHVAPRLAEVELDPVLAREPLERLRLDQREVAADPGLVRLPVAVVAVALWPPPRHDPDPLDRLGRRLVLGGQVDALDDSHQPSMPRIASSARSTPSRSTSRRVTARIRCASSAPMSTPASCSP